MPSATDPYVYGRKTGTYDSTGREILYNGPASQTPTPAATPTPPSSFDIRTNPSAPVAPDYVSSAQPGAPISRTIDSGASAAETFLNTFQAPETRDQIAERKRKENQDLIDSINKNYDTRVSASQQAGKERDNMNNALSVISGLGGSSEAVGSRSKVLDANQKEIDAINAERAQQLAGVYANINSAADEEARQQVQDATRSAEDIIARRKDAQGSAVENLKLMASSGLVDFNAFKTSPQNAKVYQYALDAVGGSEDALKGLFALNRPQDQVLDKGVVGSQMYVVYRNPLTGKTSTDHFDLGFDVPTDWKTADLGDRIMFYDPNNPDDHKYYSKGLTPDQAAKKASDAANSDQLYAGLSTPTATAVRARVNKFATEPTIQNFATVQDGYNFATSIATDTKNPADDQALIYSLAKALDPGSVVREGEYATAQKYAQSWVSAYGKGITQALAGTGFLSQTARENIKKTIEQKYQSSKKSYDNLVNQYTQGISSLTGRGDGAQFLTDYVTPSSSTGGDIRSQVTAAGYDYDQMRSDGYSDSDIKAALHL